MSIWPERPTVHGDGATWLPPRKDEYGPTPFRTCSVCLSIHPEDLLEAIRAGARMSGADWKYGWPHKFYLAYINPEPERLWVLGKTTQGGEVLEVLKGPRPTLHAKWYNFHLKELSPEAFEELREPLSLASGIRFSMDQDGYVKYQAPYHGYQRVNVVG